MPLYDFKCANGHAFERMVKLADFEAEQRCACQSPATRVISAPRISSVSYDYECPITGKAINSKHAHEENLREHGCRLYEPGETQANARARDEADAGFERSLDDSVEKAWDTMPGEKREKLTNELLSGADISIDRGTA